MSINSNTRPKFGFSKKSNTVFAAFIAHVIVCLTANPTFNVPAQELTALGNLLTAFNQAIEQALSRDTIRIAMRDSIRVELEEKMKQLGGFLMSVTSERDQLLTSGFEVVVKGGPVVTEPVENLMAFTSSIPGVGNVLLKFRSPKRAKAYLIESCTGNPNEANAVWTPAGTSSKTRFEISGLAPATYSFRVISLGARNNSIPSNFVTIAVA